MLVADFQANCDSVQKFTLAVGLSTGRILLTTSRGRGLCAHRLVHGRFCVTFRMGWGTVATKERAMTSGRVVRRSDALPKAGTRQPNLTCWLAA